MQQSSPVQPQRQDEPLPEAREVAPGIWKITLPIPFPLRTVNVHALVGNDGWALVDAGIGMPDSRAALWAGLEHVGLTLDKLRIIVLTHHHPDHVGLSGELHEDSGAAVYMHPIDEAAIQIIWSGTMPERFQSVSQFFKQHGLPPTDFWFTQVDPEVMRTIIRVPPHDVIAQVEDGEVIDLVGERYGVFLAADHVLPRITPNIGLYSERDRVNPLGDYLNSLEKVAHLSASIVLPGHGEPFADLAGRTAEIIEHHRQREMEILALLKKGPQHAYELAEQLFGHRWNNSEARRMAVAETLSHLEHLRYSGQVDQEHTTDGLILYTVV